MTPAKLAEYVRLMTRTNSTTLTDAQIIAMANARKLEIAASILAADEDILLIPQVTGLVANQREYNFPSDILSRIKRVEAKLDGTNFIKLKEVDLPQFNKSHAEADITYNFANLEGEAYYDIERKSLYIYSGTITTVASGLKVWCDTYPSDISDLTSTTDMSADPSATTHGIPIPLHELLARGVIIDYKQSREKPIPLNEREQKYEYDLARAIGVLRHGDMDREVIGHLPSADTIGNDGFEY